MPRRFLKSTWNGKMVTLASIHVSRNDIRPKWAIRCFFSKMTHKNEQEGGSTPCLLVVGGLFYVQKVYFSLLAARISGCKISAILDHFRVYISNFGRAQYSSHFGVYINNCNCSGYSSHFRVYQHLWWYTSVVVEIVCTSQKRRQKDTPERFWHSKLPCLWFC